MLTQSHTWSILLSDIQNINHKLCDMFKKANCLLASFPNVGPVILTRLFRLTVYPSMAQHAGHFPVLNSITLRLLSTRFLEGFSAYPVEVIPVQFAAQKFWTISYIDNLACHHSTSLLSAALKHPSTLVRAIFCHSSHTSYSFCGYNSLFGLCHQKHYDYQYCVSAEVISPLQYTACPNFDEDYMNI